MNRSASKPLTEGFENQSVSTNDQALSKTTVTVTLAIVIVATVAAYWPVLFNFFAGDDFVHLTWLRPAMQHPEMIWRNFHASWLDGTTTKFYRPLISIFMVTDYMMWGINGLGFHITNLIFHCASSIFLYFIVQRLAAGRDARTLPATATVWALASSAIFALYPLHTEAVSWITGRVDSIVTTFCLGSLLCYMRWRDTSGAAWLAAAVATFICGLLSKEMAITMPALFIVYEFLSQDAVTEKDLFKKSKNWILAGLKASMKTLPFWAILAVYFVIRRMALGTFVGGYDDSLLFIADPKAFALNWFHALKVFVEPINHDIIGGGNITTKVWDMFLIATVALGAFRLAKERKFAALLFVAAWLLSALAPVYKLFAILDNLQGSRLAYLASVPLSILMAYGLTGLALLSNRKLAIPLATLIPGLFAMLCGYVLYVNNEAWRDAGLEANAIRADLNRIYGSIKTDPQFLMIGLPDHINGAYVSRNALYGMTKKPQISFDAYNCVMVNEFEPIFPFGFLKESLAQNNSLVHVLRWSKDQKKFNSVVIPKNKLTEPLVVSSTALQHSKTFQPGHGTKLAIGPDKTLILSADGKHRPELMFELPETLPCWLADFVTIEATIEQRGNPNVGADLLYANDGNPEFYIGRRTHAAITKDHGSEKLLFVFRSLPDWGLGGAHPRFKLLLPPNSKIRISSVTVSPPSQITPIMAFENSGYMGTKGYLHLSAKEPCKQLDVDASSIPGAFGTMLELARPNMFFEEPNSQALSNVRSKTIRGPLKGSMQLRRGDFTGEGIVETRVWAVDKEGKPFGTSSDHIDLSLDP